jgi:flagellar motor switch protein FliG
MLECHPNPDSGIYKSAVLLVTLGPDLAAQVLSHLGEREVELLVREMAHLGHIPAGERDRVLEEFRHRLMQDSGTVGGADIARRMLEAAVGAEKAQQILGELEPSKSSAAPPLALLLEATTLESLAALVADEHPQLVALLIGQLAVERAATVLAALPPEMRGEVAARLAEMEAPSSMAVEHLERYLLEKLSSRQSARRDEVGGPKRVADILGRMRRSVETTVLQALEQQSPAIAQKVHQFRFSFEHVLQLEGRALQRVLRDVEADTLRLAMKGLDEEQQQIIYANMSERAAERLREDLDSTGPTRLRDVESAQQLMVEIARTLADSGEIQIVAGGGDEEGEEDVFV